MFFSTDGLVLRCMDAGDYDRLLTLLTPENGRISLLAKGVRSPKSKCASISQPYVYGNYEIYRKRDMNWLRGGSVTEYFAGVREELEKLALAAYISDVACEVTGEYVPGVDILRMTLNTLYGIDKEIKPREMLKAVYEWRAAGYAGYMPDVTHCRMCGKREADIMYLDVMNGRVICPECLKKNPSRLSEIHDEASEYERSILMPMGMNAVAAAQFALTALPERMFSFAIKDRQEAEQFCRAAETYLLNHLERGFDSLNFYKTIIK